jgi:hypothetical protein
MLGAAETVGAQADLFPADLSGECPRDGRALPEGSGEGQWNLPELRTLLEEVLPRDTQLSDFLVEHDFPHLGRCKMLLNARRLEGSNEREAMILLAVEDITERPTQGEES